MKQKLKFNMKHAREIPDFKPVDVKLNTAAILKEAQAIKYKKAEEEEYLKQVEVNMRDS